MVKFNIPARRYFLFILVILLPIFSCSVLADTVAVSNSEDWVDVYSVMLSSALKNEKAVFINSKTISSITKTIFSNKELYLYESSDKPIISNLDSQLFSQGYTIKEVIESDDFNLDLDPGMGNYYIISEYNPRISISAIPLAKKNNYWVLIINENNADKIVEKLRNANSVIAIGEFRRDLLNSILPYVDERINNKDPFKDSIEISKRYKDLDNIILADGSFLEEDFFNADVPVLVSGSNKLGDSTYDFFKQEGVKSVTIIGNEMAVVGEQIRENSNKQISVFIKYGQGTVSSGGQVFALSEFPLPKSKIALTITKSIYDPDRDKLVIYFENIGNTGLYELTSLSVKTNDKEIGTASDDEVRFLGAGETMPVEYDMNLPDEEITDETIVEYYTSFGVYPSELDRFLTMSDEYSPPFRTKLIIEKLSEDTSSLEIIDAAYYSNVKRVGVTLSNKGDSKVYYSVRFENLIVRGLEENLYKEDSIDPGQEKTTYISVELDEVDIQENEVFKITARYGKDQGSKFKTIVKELPFKIEKGSLLTGFAIFGGEGSGSIVIVIIVIAVIALGAYFLVIRKK